jgi:hypothetical protein
MLVFLEQNPSAENVNVPFLALLASSRARSAILSNWAISLS